MGVARRLTGLSERQIRYWEEQGLITPGRSEGGHRLYAQSDLDFLERAALMRRRGYSLEEILNTKTAPPRVTSPGPSGVRFPAPPQLREPVARSQKGNRTMSPSRGDFPATTQDRVRILTELDRRQKEITKKERD